MLILILHSCLFMIIRRKHWYPADSRLYIQQTVTYARLCTASSVSYRQCRCHRQQARDLSAQWDAWNPT